MDLICREKVTEFMDYSVDYWKKYNHKIASVLMIVREKLKELEVINKSLEITKYIPRPKGRWIDRSTPWTEIQCSNCDEIYGMEFIITTKARRNYCPNCGAEMETE